MCFFEGIGKYGNVGEFRVGLASVEISSVRAAAVNEGENTMGKQRALKTNIVLKRALVLKTSSPIKLGNFPPWAILITRENHQPNDFLLRLLGNF